MAHTKKKKKISLKNNEKKTKKNLFKKIRSLKAMTARAKRNIPCCPFFFFRQLSGWNDIGAAVNLEGEVEHPGNYGIKPGERLSSVLKRAGGFAPQAYIYGAVFTRPEVLAIEQKSRDELVQDARRGSKAGADANDDADKKMVKQNGTQQLETAISRLRHSSRPVVIRIPANLSNGKELPTILCCAARTLVIPKAPNFVVVSGAVYDETAVT